MTIDDICATVEANGYCHLTGSVTTSLLEAKGPHALADRDLFEESWSRLPLDGYVAQRYRRRRYAVLQTNSADSGFVIQPHQPHYQSAEHNRIFGGVQRAFEPIEPATLNGATMHAIIELTRGRHGRVAAGTWLGP